MVTISTVTMKSGEKKIKLVAPYHPDMPAGARALGGKFSSDTKAWYFDTRDEQRVRELAREIYGTDGLPVDNADLVTLRVTFTEKVWALRESVFVAGRCVARAWGRDSGARLGEGVVLLEGKIGSGGSRNNWYTIVETGTVVEIRDVPRRIAEAVTGENDYTVEILDNNSPAVNLEALQAEKEALLKRLAEIEALLGSANVS